MHSIGNMEMLYEVPFWTQQGHIFFNSDADEIFFG